MSKQPKDNLQKYNRDKDNAPVNFMPHPPGRVGDYKGFDKLRSQIPHPWGKIVCQIPSRSPTPL